MTITIDLNDESARRLRDLAATAGRPVEDYVRDLVVSATEPPDPLIGRFAADAEILDRIVEEAMTARERQNRRPAEHGQGAA